MKVILAGHPGSKHILAASCTLAVKYLPSNFELHYLNYGPGVSMPFCTYVHLDEMQRGGAEAWSAYLRGYIKFITDARIVFGLDDYLLSKPLDVAIFSHLICAMNAMPEIACARLCDSSCYNPGDMTMIDDNIFILNPGAEYSVTTQYCIWDKAFLVELLGRTADPWDFEIGGSGYLSKSGRKVIGSITPALQYNVHSALSSRWPGKVRVGGLSEADTQALIKNGYLKESELIQ